ncbi:hypothetical protein EYF80_008189 [Liparis tanakae]|uniref:Uncharacterized protein n=1 Tax=Liparis tanakae TaxID=230148 RepID=A0A4Z2IWV4_9TELE|nr:hypothetical protein EYF80_008189 [Liparis tanakae]
MLIPRVMNGLEKSITFSLSDVMVKPATARSAFCGVDEERWRDYPEEKCDLTSMVVTVRVLFASFSETLISRLVEFIARVLLEYQTPI